MGAAEDIAPEAIWLPSARRKARISLRRLKVQWGFFLNDRFAVVPRKWPGAERIAERLREKALRLLRRLDVSSSPARFNEFVTKKLSKSSKKRIQKGELAVGNALKNGFH